MIYLEHYLFLAAIIFTIGVLGIFLNKKNVIFSDIVQKRWEGVRINGSND